MTFLKHLPYLLLKLRNGVYKLRYCDHLTMDSCIGVEQDLDKALTKFTCLNDNTNRVLKDILEQVQALKQEVAKRKCSLFSVMFVYILGYDMVYFI